MKLVNKFKKKTVVLDGDVLDAEAAVKLRHAGFVPGNKALCPGASIFTSPKEGTPSSINGVDHTSRKEQGGHVVYRHAAKNSVSEHKAPARGE
jgi:hypothetical protein